jgi:thiamine biosynthesis lipoprotein
MAAVVLVSLLALRVGWAGPPPAAATPDHPEAGNATVPPSPPLSRARFLMGTRLVIEARGPEVEAAIEAAFREVERLDAVLSNWRADSELSRLNRSAVAGPVPCSADLCAAVTAALHWAATTGGAFDPTVEPLVRRLGLREPGDLLPGVPGGPGLDGVGGTDKGDPIPPAIGWRHVQVDAPRQTIAFDAPGVGIDLGGIGKGFALDAALRILNARGVEAALLDFGGQVLVHGQQPGRGSWLVSIADPEDRDRPAGALRLREGSVSTSGNSERALRRSGTIVGHILDPASGGPAEFRGTATVIAADGTSADALSTALFVMGPRRGIAWAETHHVEALYQARDGETSRRWSTPGFPSTDARGDP